MLISHEKKFIFIRIGKTGGRSVLTALQEVVPDSIHVRPLHYATYREIRNFVGDEVWRSYFKFSFVRNPWDRTVSLFHFLRQYKAKQEKGTWKQYAEASFDEFLDLIEQDTSLEAIHHEPQHRFIMDGVNAQVDYLGRFETLSSDFNVICEHLGVGHPALPHYYKTERENYRHYYDEKTRMKVSERFKKDAEFFSYEY